MEFKKKIRHAAGQEQGEASEEYQPASYRHMAGPSYPLFLYFPMLFLSKPSISLACPTFDASAKHPVSLV